MDRKMKGWGKRVVVCLLVLTLLAQLIPVPGQSNAAMAAAELFAASDKSASSLPASTDISGHWAENTIRVWLQEGLVSGLPNGSFHPDNKVIRAELVAMINRAFQYTKAASSSFADISSAKWYALDVARAKEAGYMQGDGKDLFRPEASVTREEAAVIIARLLKLDTGSQTESGKFADAKSIANWSRGAISAVVAAGIMKGYGGNVFKARQPLTRAEAVVILDRVRKQADLHTNPSALSFSIDKAGTYGPVSGKETHEGDLAINVPNVVLRNVTIKGNLLLGEGIGEGDVTLDRVVVEGTTTVKGGGKNSVHVLDSALSRVVITKVGGQVRVVIEGSTAVDQVSVESGATLQVAGGSGASYGTVKVSTTGEVTLDGDFPDVVVVAPAQLTVTSGKVGNLTLTEQAAGADVTLHKNSQVTNVNAGAAATIKGDGKIDTASVTAPGVTIAQKPTQTVVADGISANVGGTVTQGSGSSGSGSSGSGSSGSGSGGGPTVVGVTVTVGNPSAGGFDLLLTPAVPNMTSTNLIMVNADGMPALVSKLRSTDQAGVSYRAEGFLTGGEAYTLSLAKPGYTFGASKTVSIPDVPAVTGALVSPELTKLTLLFSKPLASLPSAPAGFTLTDSGAPVAITGATLSESATRLELALGASVNPNTLELKYVPGTIHSTDNKALPALTWRSFTNGGTPGGRAAYNRMLGKTAEQTADDLKNNASVNASVAAKALIEGGYNTNALIKALNTVYRVTNENMPGLLLPQGISVYHLLIGMKEAGILDVQNLGKNFSFLDGQSDDWVRALKEAGYTDEQVTSYSWFFPNVKLAASMRTHYGTSNERAAKLFAMHNYGSFSNDVGRVLKEVYGNDDWQAVSALKAAGINASKAGMVLKDIYGATTDRIAGLLKDSGYAAADIGKMFLLDFAVTPLDTVKVMSAVGFTIGEIWGGLAYANTQADALAALRGSFTALEVYKFLYSLDHRVDTVVSSLKYGGYSAIETAGALMETNPDIRTRADLMAQLMQTDPLSAATYRYDAVEAVDAVRKKYGGTLAALAALLTQFGATTVTTMRPGQVTVVAGLVRAGFNAGDIVQWLAPSNTLTQTQATNIVLELRNAGYPLSSMSNVLKSLAVKVYSNSSSPNQIKLLSASGLNTSTSEPIPGYSASEIAKYVVGAGFSNYSSLVADLQLVFSKLDTARAIAEASGYSVFDMLNFMGQTRMFQGSTDVLFLGQVLKEIYGLSSEEAVRALKGSSVPVMYDFVTIVDVLRRGYGHTDTTVLIGDLAASGFTMNQIGDGLVLNGAAFKTANYSATEIAKYLVHKQSTQMSDMAMALHTLGYNLNEIATALRNLYAGNAEQAVPAVTTWLNALPGYSSEEITATVTAVFNVDPFALMAQSLFRGSYSATQAAVALKDQFTSTDSVAMARGLAAAGYSRDSVLVAIFQAYCDGYIYKEGALSTMDNVIATVYPEVTNRLDATLKASDVRTAKYAISVMKSLGKSFEETIGVLERVYGLDSSAVLEVMMANRLFGLGEDGIVSKVGAYYRLDPATLYVGWMAAHHYKAYDVLAVIQQTYRNLDGVTIARLLNQAGYTKESILFAYDYNFHGDYVNEMALVMVQLFGSSDMQSVATELLQWGYKGLLVYPALKGAFPNKSQGDILVVMKQAGFTDLFDAIRYSISNGDSTAIMQLRNLGLSLSNANYLLALWQYSLRDTIRYLIEVGYPLADIGRILGEPDKLVKHLRALNYPLETVVKVVYGADPRPSMLVQYLYNNGYKNIDDLVKALKIVNCNPYDYAISLWFGPYGPWTLGTIAQAIARNSTLTLVQLGQSLMQSYDNSRYFTDMQVYEALKSVSNIGVSFIQADLDSAISAMLTDLSEGIPFAIMREAGLSSNDAARVMRKLGWDWIPACIQLVQAGYSAGDTWGTLWDVYHNELGFQVLNIMSAVAPLASLGLADNLTLFQTVTRAALRKAMMNYFLSQ
ncbi:S-layer homology domain-containing protein [Cohnella silvisoli]|uniref:S-layer homology domain-containing protein n=1 Tax=Cohnella silvisoli TaxID=2873699 RepID=A0ABV1L510_9BACL|nr:S-layer homology domain-containing protein [Cohnella silvisoli]MCD9026437.1 S-layer homology domain-containing protein [Cohnella silvisoli]